MKGGLEPRDFRFAIVVSRFNQEITERLLAGAQETFRAQGVDPGRVDIVWVPGALELPLIAKTLAETQRYGAIVALGCVIKHETKHFDLVSEGAAQGLAQASLETGVPILNAVLACYDEQQALARAGGAQGNKGSEAALAALEMANLLRDIKAD